MVENGRLQTLPEMPKHSGLLSRIPGPYKFFGAVFLICILLCGAWLLAFVRQFHQNGLSSDPGDWAIFSNYIGPLVSLLSFLGTLAAGVYATMFLPQKFEQSRRGSERVKAAVALSQVLYGRDFYLYITVPAWEIAVKWRCWQGAAGDNYRLEVIGGLLLYKLIPFSNAAEANQRRYGNIIRFTHHFDPYDKVRSSGATENSQSVIRELSEHQALNSWLNFWCNLESLVKNDDVDQDVLTDLFVNWYWAWLDFMLDLRFTIIALIRRKESEKNATEVAFAAKRWVEQLCRLEARLFVHYGEHYQERLRKAQEDAEPRAAKLWQMHNDGSDKTT